MLALGCVRGRPFQTSHRSKSRDVTSGCVGGQSNQNVTHHIRSKVVLCRGRAGGE